MKHIYSWFDKRNEKAIPHCYGLAYSEFVRGCDIYYPIPINYLVRYCRATYWWFLRAIYWVGLIDTKYEEVFRWSDFWRVSPRR